jgi:hypothetical protein
MVVDALQCNQSKTIATDLGFVNVKPGDWVVCGEGGETYIIDDEYFQRAFVPAQETPRISLPEPSDAQFAAPTERALTPVASSRTCFSRDRARRPIRLARRRKARISQ